MTAPPTGLRSRIDDAMRRFDARNRRERLMLIGAALAVAFFVVDAVALGPALKTWRAAVRQQHAAQTAAAAQAVESSRREVERVQLLRARQSELDSWRRRVREGEDALRAHQSALVGPEQMVALLEQMLAQRGQIRLRSMQTLARTDLLPPEGHAAATGPAAAASAVSTPARSVSPGAAETAASAGMLYRHGVELTVEGSFAELLDYVRALEAMPQRVLWGKVAFKVEQYPKASLTLRLYTVSRERHWLEI